jgi:hypothetical protein
VACAHVQQTPARDVNIRCVEELILGNRRITMRGIAFNSVETIIHERLFFKTVCAWWLRQAEHLHQFEMEENISVGRTVTFVEM